MDGVPIGLLGMTGVVSGKRTVYFFAFQYGCPRDARRLGRSVKPRLPSHLDSESNTWPELDAEVRP